jgi:hypothetical protein
MDSVGVYGSDEMAAVEQSRLRRELNWEYHWLVCLSKNRHTQNILLIICNNCN